LRGPSRVSTTDQTVESEKARSNRPLDRQGNRSSPFKALALRRDRSRSLVSSNLGFMFLIPHVSLLLIVVSSIAVVPESVDLPSPCKKFVCRGILASIRHEKKRC
jgi:hypothetical protein